MAFLRSPLLNLSILLAQLGAVVAQGNGYHWGNQPPPWVPPPVPVVVVPQETYVPPAPVASSGPTTSTGGTGCITFSFSGSGFAFDTDQSSGANWPCSSGTGGTSCCVLGSGGIFISSNSANVRQQSTKLECTIAGASGKNWCNLSLIDGYSVPVQCTVPSATTNPVIGGLTDLYGNGACPSGLNTFGNCPNPGGHSNSAVDWFKQGGKYWYQDNVGTNMADWTGDTGTVECIVGTSTPKKLKPRDERLLGLEQRNRPHGHGKRAHARSLKFAS